MLSCPGVWQWREVQEAVVEDGSGVEDARPLGRVRDSAPGLAIAVAENGSGI